ncbi:MAG: META domain-containing protein [Dysgonamonadaceae bacterium]|jgi:heat shock protein HslJ|nr:META domain-containing protein [Dysgonamonadaceae bacterium]
MKKNIIIMVCAISMFMGFNACKSKQYAEVAEPVSEVNSLLAGKRWKLVELNGKPVEKQDAFLLLDKDKSTVSGNLGCNTFSGTYELKTGNRIKFSSLAATLKMCLDMEIEDGLKKVLEIADNYTVNEETLILNRLRMAPLAKFELEK